VLAGVPVPGPALVAVAELDWPEPHPAPTKQQTTTTTTKQIPDFRSIFRAFIFRAFTIPATNPYEMVGKRRRVAVLQHGLVKSQHRVIAEKNLSPGLTGAG
jgi:hypothetical protein